MCIVVAAGEHLHGWPRVMVNGFIGLLPGIHSCRHFPESEFWVIGLFVDIDMIFSGWSWIMAALGACGALAGEREGRKRVVLPRNVAARLRNELRPLRPPCLPSG